MLRSISSDLCFAHLAWMACLLSQLAAGQVIDDAALKRSFEESLSEALESRKFPQTERILRQLSEQNTPRLSLPPSSTGSSIANPVAYPTSKASTLVIGHLYRGDNRDEWHSNLAGGVALTSDGLVLTNYHVINFDQAEIFGGMTHDGRVYPVVEVVASSRKDDLAVIRLSGATDLSPVSLADEAPVGIPVHVLSHPDSHFFTLTSGHISRYSRSPKTKTKHLEITADFARGSSGSGVFNHKGELVGLVASTKSIYYDQEHEHPEHLQMVIKSCVPLSSIRSLIQRPN